MLAVAAPAIVDKQGADLGNAEERLVTVARVDTGNVAICAVVAVHASALSRMVLMARLYLA